MIKRKTKMKKIKKNKKITFTYLPEKDEYTANIGDEIYESEDKCFIEIEDEFNDIPISELPPDVIINTGLSGSVLCVDTYIRRNERNFVEVVIILHIHRKTWYEQIDCEIYFEAFEKMLKKYTSYNINNISKEYDPDCCSLTFTMEFIAQHIIDVRDKVKGFNDEINDAIFKAVETSINLFWELIQNNKVD